MRGRHTGRLIGRAWFLAMAGIVPVLCHAAPITNVILIIGDGMGTGQIEAARCYLGRPLVMEGLPHQSWMTTYAANADITDSAASGTAMATGHKVNNGVVSVALPGNGSDLPTILEYYQARGKMVGLVTTTYIEHATPAVFAAHRPLRTSYGLIAADYLQDTKPNVLFGGVYATGVNRTNAENAGYTVVTNAADLAAMDTESETYVSGQFGVGLMPYEVDGMGDLPHLHEMAQAALDILDNDPDGFFLMVEGGLIDYGGHGNDIAATVGEMVEFDITVQVVLDWATNRTDTLVVITADHETGGLSVTNDNGPGVLPGVVWTSTWHTAQLVPVYGWGLKAECVSNVTDNTDIYSLLRTPLVSPAAAMAATASLSNTVADTSWSVIAGDVYRLERATDLYPADWTPLVTVTAVVSRITISDTNLTAATELFYRLISVE